MFRLAKTFRILFPSSCISKTCRVVILIVVSPCWISPTIFWSTYSLLAPIFFSVSNIGVLSISQIFSPPSLLIIKIVPGGSSYNSRSTYSCTSLLSSSSASRQIMKEFTTSSESESDSSSFLYFIEIENFLCLWIKDFGVISDIYLSTRTFKAIASSASTLCLTGLSGVRVKKNPESCC